MRSPICNAFGILLLTILTSMSAQALTITLDLNGFVGSASITGEGIDGHVTVTPGDQVVQLENLQAGSTYLVDFLHSSGSRSSDFEFVVNKAGTGVASVGPGGDRFTMVKDFKPGATTLQLNTFKVVFNPDKTQTGGYTIRGMTQEKVAPGSGPVTAVLIPGKYIVDNFGGPAGANEYEFNIDSNGRAIPYGRADEYAVFAGSTISPRVVKVHFVITASGPIEYVGTHAILNASTTPANVTELDMMVPVGGGGITITSFGPNTVGASNVIAPDGSAMQASESDDNLTFNPRICFDARRGFFFETARGPAVMVMAEVAGKRDDKQTELKVKIVATVPLPPKPTTAPATRPATQPARPGAPR